MHGHRKPKSEWKDKSRRFKKENWKEFDADEKKRRRHGRQIWRDADSDEEQMTENG